MAPFSLGALLSPASRFFPPELPSMRVREWGRSAGLGQERGCQAGTVSLGRPAPGAQTGRSSEGTGGAWSPLRNSAPSPQPGALLLSYNLTSTPEGDAPT